MNTWNLGRIALVGALVVALVATLVLSGAGMVLADPDQRAEGDAVAGEGTFRGTVVAEDPVTIETEDGQTIVLDSLDPAAVEEGQTVDAEISLAESGANTDAIGRTAGEEYFMYAASALAGLLVLALLLDTWRLRPLQLRLDPRSKPVHTQIIERIRDHFAEGRTETLDPHRTNRQHRNPSDRFDRGGTDE